MRVEGKGFEEYFGLVRVPLMDKENALTVKLIFKGDLGRCF